jgi:hypothetical protein
MPGKRQLQVRGASLLVALAVSGVPVLRLSLPAIFDGLGAARFEKVLTGLLAAALLVSWAWLVLGAVATTIETMAGAAGGVGRRLTPRLVRSLVAAACGVGVAGGVLGPAVAEGAGPTHPWSQAQVLDGLALPDRTEGGSPQPATPPHRDPREHQDHRDHRDRRDHPVTITVRSGDTLWSIAAAVLGPDAAPGEVSRAWQRLYAANRERIGADPDLIVPGTVLRLPRPDHAIDEAAHHRTHTGRQAP